MTPPTDPEQLRGWRAYFAGYLPSDNPHQLRAPAYTRWLQGWLAARNHDQAHRRPRPNRP